MPLSPFIKRTAIKSSTSRGPTPLARVKAKYSAIKQQSASSQSSQIQQLSRDQARIASAIPGSSDPVKTSLQRRSSLVSNRIGWLQSQTIKK